MSEQSDKEVTFVTKSLAAAGFSTSLYRFGRAATGHNENESDLDIAVVIPLVEKSEVVAHLRQLGGSPRRSMNWAIDVFNRRGQTFGYNKKAYGTLHLLVMSQEEYEGDTPLAVNVRAAAETNDLSK